MRIRLFKNILNFLNLIFYVNIIFVLIFINKTVTEIAPNKMSHSKY